MGPVSATSEETKAYQPLLRPTYPMLNKRLGLSLLWTELGLNFI